MKIVLALLLCVLYVEARPRLQLYESFERTPFIVGGRQVSSKGRWPWQLSLRRGGHICGAVVHSAGYALTAAHCTDSGGSFTVRGGMLRQSPADHEQQITVARTIEHPNWGSGRSGNPNDVCVLDLAGNFRLGGNVRAARMPNRGEDFVGDDCWISGWGRTSGTGGSANILKEASMDLISNSRCANLMPSNLRSSIISSHICVHDPGENKGSCQGDSGGPLHCNAGGWKVAGVTSWGVGNAIQSCMQEYPSVYTRLSSHLGFINGNTYRKK